MAALIRGEAAIVGASSVEPSGVEQSDDTINETEANTATVDQDNEIVSDVDLSSIVELMSASEIDTYNALKTEVRICKEKVHTTEESFNRRIAAKESHLNEVNIQLKEAQVLEESLTKNIKRVSKDIEVLQKNEIEIRNEITTERRQYLNEYEIQKDQLTECMKRLDKVESDIFGRIDKRQKEAVTTLNTSGASALSIQAVQSVREFLEFKIMRLFILLNAISIFLSSNILLGSRYCS